MSCGSATRKSACRSTLSYTERCQVSSTARRQLAAPRRAAPRRAVSAPVPSGCVHPPAVGLRSFVRSFGCLRLAPLRRTKPCRKGIGRAEREKAKRPSRSIPLWSALWHWAALGRVAHSAVRRPQRRRDRPLSGNPLQYLPLDVNAHTPRAASVTLPRSAAASGRALAQASNV